MKWRLEDLRGQSIGIIEAESCSEAVLYGTRNYIDRFHQAVDSKAWWEKQEASNTRLMEAFRRGFLKEGMSSEDAEKMSIFAVEEELWDEVKE